MKKNEWKTNEMVNSYVISYRFADIIMMIFLFIFSFIFMMALKGMNLVFAMSFTLLLFFLNFFLLMVHMYSKKYISKYWTLLEKEIEIATKKDGTIYTINKNEVVNIIGGGKYHIKIGFFDSKGVMHTEKVDNDFLKKTNLKTKR